MNRRRIATFAATLAAAFGAAGTAQAAPPNDQYFAKQWGPSQIKAPEAWTTSTGAGSTIAIVDSGVDLSHPDLAGKIAGGATFAGCGDRPAGCGNGDWESGPASNGPGDPHGTHVAGTAAATTNNGTGIAGVAPDARILAVKALGSEGGTFEEIAAGIRWSADNGADVINLSLGALPGAQALTITGLVPEARDAVAYASSKGVVVVAAAGNDTASICGTPGFEPGALCVVSNDRNEARSYFSNFALNEDLETVSAPGGAGTIRCADDIISTVPTDAPDGGCERSQGTPGYDFYAGTSMATPHVAGVAALLTAQGRSRDNVVDTLMATARTPGAGTRGTYTPVYGSGIVDAKAAVAAPGAQSVAATKRGGRKPRR